MISTHIKAVIFDVRSLSDPTVPSFSLSSRILVSQIGGVVVRSPLLAIAAFEEEKRLPRNYINCAMYVSQQLPHAFLLRETLS